MKIHDILTNDQYDDYSADQKAQLDRMSKETAEHIYGQKSIEKSYNAEDEEKSLAEVKKDIRDKRHNRIQNESADALRCAINIKEVGSVINFSVDNNYSSNEQEAINAKFSRYGSSDWKRSFSATIQSYNNLIANGHSHQDIINMISL